MIGILRKDSVKMNKQPLVSVVIPTYGRSELLGRAIDSVLAQTYDHIEIIVVDDNDKGSEDQLETEHQIRLYIQNRDIIYLKHEKNAGGSAARNTGIKASKGEYIALLDDDDEWFPQKLEKQIAYFKDLNEKVGVIYCSYILEEYHGDREIIRTERGDLTKELLLLKFDPGASSTLVFRKNVLDKIGYFDQSFVRHQDLEVLIRLCREYLIDVCPDVLLRINGHNFPSASKIEKVKKVFFDTFKNDIKNLSFIDQKKVYAKHYIELSLLFLNERNFFKIIQYYFIATGYYPPILFHNKVNARLMNYLKKRMQAV
jgi:glycosyltransferase involved in cell wall biosynthesis